MANLKAFLQNLYDKNPEGFEVYTLNYDMNFKSLPIALSADEDSDEDTDEEEVDFENNEILSIDFDTNTIEFVAGGDWQAPTQFSVTLKDDAFFHLNEDTVILDAQYEDGLTTEEVVKMIER